MPLRIEELGYDFRIRWSVSQENAWDADDKWWATINVIFDSGTNVSEPLGDDRLFDIVIELDRYEQDDLTDVSKEDKDVYWWFARNTDGTLRPFVLHIDGQDYEWGVRYKFFQNLGYKNDKVHVKFIPIDNTNVAPYIDHPLRVFTEAAKDFLQFCDNMDLLERELADTRVSQPSLWIKAIAAGYETYTGASILKQDELRVVSDKSPPTPPTNLVATTTPFMITLHWDDHQDPSLHGYIVSRSDDDGITYSELSRNVDESTFVDTNDVIPGMVYKYNVKALDRSFNESPKSNDVSVTAYQVVTAAPTTAAPTRNPTALPTRGPTVTPTAFPTDGPTRFPSAAPTSRPPTPVPTRSPTAPPTSGPTGSPTRSPTTPPTKEPTTAPTKVPSVQPVVPTCTPCTDVAPLWMVESGKTCATAPRSIQTGCNADATWIRKTFCQQTCYEAGRGYVGDWCCVDY
jgi:hypothetical protein